MSWDFCFGCQLYMIESLLFWYHSPSNDVVPNVFLFVRHHEQNSELEFLRVLGHRNITRLKFFYRTKIPEGDTMPEDASVSDNRDDECSFFDRL